MKNQPTELELSVFNFFKEILPYYDCESSTLPATIKLKLALNGWGSVWQACECISRMLLSPKLKKQANAMLVHQQAFGNRAQ